MKKHHRHYPRWPQFSIQDPATYLVSNYLVLFKKKKFLSLCVFSSTENGEKEAKEEKEEKAEKAEKAEPEPEVKEEEPEEKEEMTVKTKAKKDKKPAEEGFELWNELEVQRIKFMVSIPVLQHLFKFTQYIHTQSDRCCNILVF